MRENTERWMELARLASTEQDPVKLLALITEINRLLLEKEEHLIKTRTMELGNSKYDKMRIFIADDSPIYRKLVETTLAPQYAISLAKN